MFLRPRKEQGALQPPPVTTLNFKIPPNMVISFETGFAVCVGISGLFVLARTYTRLRLMKKWGAEDCELLDIVNGCMLIHDKTSCGYPG